ncbi:MAG TPA: integrase [Ktedonobacteraceae bacterium]
MGTAHRKSIVKEALDRLDAKMAIGQSRRDAKQAMREEQGRAWSVSTGRIHSYKTRSSYQEYIVRFIKWARETYHTVSLMQLDPRAEALATEYLQLRLAESKSPYTLQAERAALRLFFNDRALAATVPIPRRVRARITRSRGPKKHDRHFQPANWPELVRFEQATGLRRHEVRALRCHDIFQRESQLLVHVASGKGGLARDVPVLPGREGDVQDASAGRDPDASVFARIPKHMDVHSYRREYAQALYLVYAPGRALPPATGRLKRSDYDREAAEQVSHALGHRRVDVVLKHYLR